MHENKYSKIVISEKKQVLLHSKILIWFKGDGIASNKNGVSISMLSSRNMNIQHSFLYKIRVMNFSRKEPDFVLCDYYIGLVMGWEHVHKSGYFLLHFTAKSPILKRNSIWSKG